MRFLGIALTRLYESMAAFARRRAVKPVPVRAVHPAPERRSAPVLRHLRQIGGL